MANLLQSSQTQETTAPGFYTKYLSDLSGNAANAAQNAQYVGATDLQNQAFQNVGGAGTAFKPTLEAAGSTLGAAAGSSSPLSAANPYLSQATSDVGATASGLMNPYMTNVVNAIGDAGQRNIQQNLAPGATAGAVGSGQFGSKRGAEVLGQTMSNADRDILNAQASALGTGYNTALQTALGEKQVANTAGQTASNAASAGQQNLTQAGNALGNLATTNQNLNLNDINALSTLGAQQQTIAQNQQLFPLNNLSTLSGVLRGYNIPTSTTTTAEQSPLSVLAGATTGAAGLFAPMLDAKGNPIIDPATGQPRTNYSQFVSGLSNAYNTFAGNNSATPNTTDTSGNYNGTVSNTDLNGNPIIPGSENDPNSYGNG
jgi:hypothetical protein